MVDSNDRDRIGEARDELHRMLNEVCCTIGLLPLLLLHGMCAAKQMLSDLRVDVCGLDSTRRDRTRAFGR